MKSFAALRRSLGDCTFKLFAIASRTIFDGLNISMQGNPRLSTNACSSLSCYLVTGRSDEAPARKNVCKCTNNCSWISMPLLSLQKGLEWIEPDIFQPHSNALLMAFCCLIFFIHSPITNAFENAPKWEFRLPANTRNCQVCTKLHRSFRLWFWTCCYLSHCQSHDPRSSTKRWIDIGVDVWRCDIDDDVKALCLPSGKHFSISMFHTPRFLTVASLFLFPVEPFT